MFGFGGEYLEGEGMISMSDVKKSYNKNVKKY